MRRLDAGAIEGMAGEALTALRTGRQIEPFSVRYPAFDAADAYRVMVALHRQRERRGEKIVGRKIGRTNRKLRADLPPPMWGFVYDRTVYDLPAGRSEFPLAGLMQPRIEPEIVFGLSRPPAIGMDEQEVLGCIEWAAHGFEIIQSIFPDWKSSAADSIAANAVHGALLIGPRRKVAARLEAWKGELRTFAIELCRNDAIVARGHGMNVLDGPASTLQHLVQLLAADPINPPLAAGEIITTGTLTTPLTIERGETWSTRLAGISLDGLCVHFA
jgi:2-oxo-3-hexenedioate decarboxylase